MRVRAWYGLTGEIEVENELWHLVKVDEVAVNHPPIVKEYDQTLRDLED